MTSSSASGKLFLDDGVDLIMDIADGKSTFVQYYAEKTAHSGSVVGRVIYGDYAMQQGLLVHTVKLLGVTGSLSELCVNGESVLLSSVKLAIDVSVPSVEISRLSLPVGQNFELKWEIAATQ
jgi:alpha-D-xyloside xylohydrolase